MKYKELEDKNWLINKYCQEELSSTEISKLIGCHRTSVTLALNRWGIRLRTSRESNRIILKKSPRKSSYLRLNDKNVLQKLYIDQKKSMNEIATLFGVKSSNSVRQALLRSNIPVRSVSDGLIVNNDPFEINYDIVIGSLLGDGSFRCGNRNTECSYPSFYKKNKFYEHIFYVAKSFFQDEAQDYISEEWKNDKPYYRVRTPVCKDFKLLDQNWYPKWNDFKKVIPGDLEINPQIMLHWFLDDGSTSWRKQRKSQSVRLVFCSESFERNNQLMLVDKINEKYNLCAGLSKINSGTTWRIKIPHKCVGDFFDLIGESPIKALAYKWKLP